MAVKLSLYWCYFFCSMSQPGIVCRHWIVLFNVWSLEKNTFTNMRSLDKRSRGRWSGAMSSFTDWGEESCIWVLQGWDQVIPITRKHWNWEERQIANLLNCTSWSGAGPGLMDAATKGALQAGKPVGGFKIGKEAGEWTASKFHPYLPTETYLTCRFFSARKHGLVDAAVRSNSSDRTAVVALPGGIGTLDEVFEILALIQLERIGTVFPVPFLLMNYDSFYSRLLDFLDDCEDWGTVAKGEVSSLWKVCDNNVEALAYLEEFYQLPTGKFRHKDGLRSPHGAVS